MALKRACSSVIALALGFSAAACGGGAHAFEGAAAKVPLAPAGVLVEDDVAAGFSAYENVLARWGRWSPDARYGVQWCPNHDQVAGYGLPFEPYRTGGHWDTSDTSDTSIEKPLYGAPPGAPYWVSDDSETWGEITMHHGYWVQRFVDPTRGARASDWCWIPGVSPTAARVVWRSGGGFVGWAPEPPSWVDDGGQGLYADFVWTFVMTGALLEALLDDQILTDDAAQIAAESTMPFGVARERPFVRTGPAVATVAQAKRELAAYVRAHPEIPSNSSSAVARATAASNGSTSANGAGSGSGGASGTSGTASHSGPDAKSKATKKSDDEPMPQASIVVSTMMRDPMIGPIGVTPRFIRPAVAPFEPATGAALESGAYDSSSSSSSSSGHESGSGHSGFASVLSAVGHVASAAASTHAGSSSSSSSHSSGASSSSSSSSHSSSSSSSSSHSSGASGASSSSSSSHSSARH